MISRSAGGLLVTLVSFFAGCTRQPVAVRPAEIDPEAAADRLLQEYDRDANGSLSAAEASSCFGLTPHFKRYDANGDGAASREELRARFQQWSADDVGIMRVGCRVKLDGKPLSGGQVALQPHSFLGDALMPAIGTTNAYGQCSLSVAAADLPAALQRVRGVQPGLYLVRITHPQVEVPAQYNTETTVGLEVAGDTIGPAGVELTLTSR